MAFRLPPQAAPAEGTPRTRPRRIGQAREAHHPGAAAPLPQGGCMDTGHTVLLITAKACRAALTGPEVSGCCA
jgi:hypothetical protein